MLRSAMLDGDIVHLNPDGTSSFGALLEDLSDEHPERLTYFLFDLLALDDYVLTGCRLEATALFVNGDTAIIVSSALATK